MCPRWDEKLGINILNTHFFFLWFEYSRYYDRQNLSSLKNFPAMNQFSMMAHFVGLLVGWKQSVENEFRIKKANEINWREC